jgi:hypothetical protein
MKKALLLSTLALAVSVATSASATNMNAHGDAFQPYYASDISYINHYISGTYNSSTVSKYVIMGVPRVPHDSGSQTVYIDGYHTNTTVSTSCSVYAYDYDGTYKSSKSVSASGASGYWERSVAFTTTEAPVWAYYVVLCYLPGNNAAGMFGVILN